MFLLQVKRKLNDSFSEQSVSSAEKEFLRELQQHKLVVGILFFALSLVLVGICITQYVVAEDIQDVTTFTVRTLR